jgi:hypothetical protein
MQYFPLKQFVTIPPGFQVVELELMASEKIEIRKIVP